MLLFTQGEKDMLDVIIDPFIQRNIVSFLISSKYHRPDITLRDSTVILVSGNLSSFLLTKLEDFQDEKVLCIVDSHCPGRLRNGKPTCNDSAVAHHIDRLRYTKWIRLKHTSTGGPTDYVALLAYSNISQLPIASTLQRVIRHVFNGGIRPGPPPRKLESDHFGIYYLIDDRLRPGFYQLPVLCPSHFHASGRGYRVLTTEELAHAHGFPRQFILQNFPSNILMYPPCQLLTSSLDPIWQVSDVRTDDGNPRPVKRSRELLQTWIPGIKRHLSHSWIDVSLITATASKADNAALPCRLWDSRLQLLFPGIVPFLDSLRRRLLQSRRLHLLREIRAYMSRTFGCTWSRDLIKARHLGMMGSLRKQRGGGTDDRIGDRVTYDRLGDRVNRKEKDFHRKKEVSKKETEMILSNRISFNQVGEIGVGSDHEKFEVGVDEVVFAQDKVDVVADEVELDQENVDVVADEVEFDQDKSELVVKHDEFGVVVNKAGFDQDEFEFVFRRNQAQNQSETFAKLKGTKRIRSPEREGTLSDGSKTPVTNNLTRPKSIEVIRNSIEFMGTSTTTLAKRDISLYKKVLGASLVTDRDSPYTERDIVYSKRFCGGSRNSNKLVEELQTSGKAQHKDQWTSCRRNSNKLVAELQTSEKGERNNQWTLSKTRDVLLLEAEKVTEVLSKICNASWWEWDNGSALFFWRWGEHSDLASDGMVPFLISELPLNRKKGKSLVNGENIHNITEKLATILKKGYIEQGNVKSLIDFFAVPKGTDIRLVYNGSSCGLNASTWAPNFWLPYPRTALRLLDYGFYSVDVDLGEMFLNFPLHESIRSYSGIDLSPYQAKLGIGNGKKTAWYRWTRNWMGARMSPYSSVQFCSLAEEFCRGNNIDASNPLRWDVIILNLPGSKGYYPSKPRVYKWDKTSLCLAGELVIFVDDVRVTGKTIELAWQIARQVCSRFQFLGVQDATRKRKPPTRTPGAWAGAVFATTEEKITKTVTQEKWDKARNIINTLNRKIRAGGSSPNLLFKELEVARGFLVHLSMTYEVLVPFLKGFHLALASHLPKRDQDGWKLTDKAWSAYLLLRRESLEGIELEIFQEDQKAKDSNEIGDQPQYVVVSDHLRNDLFALGEFTECKVPPIVNDRSANVRIVRYGFGDASGSGFGSTIQTAQGLKYRVGIWGSDEEEESSNFKELENVVTTIEEEAISGNLNDAALFFFTDNTTVEAALFKGNSSSQKLFQLVVRFRKIQLIYGMQVIVSHVSGKRMIHQGTDGVSRGNMKEGVGSGKDMIQFIPLHQGGIERHPQLLDWIKAWGGNNVEYLTPNEWYTRGHDHWKGKTDHLGFWRIHTKPGIFVWAPPPAAAEIAIEQLRRAIIKRQNSTHILVCPRLLTTEWFKQLHKVSDLVVSLPAMELMF